MSLVELVRTYLGTEIHVAEFGLRGGNLRVDSCNKCEPAPRSTDWPKSTRDEIITRLAEGGGPKGRILYARAIQFPGLHLVPAGAMTLHLEDGLVRALHLGHAVGTIGFQRTAATSMLIQCASQVAAKHGCARLEFLIHRDADVRTYRDYGFRRLARRDHSYAGLHGNDILIARQL